MDAGIEVLFEDEELVVVNKPSGLLSEGGEGRERDLEQLVSETVGRPAFCCHRLDRLTSGVLLLRKRNRLKRELAELFEKRRVRKSYWLLVDGIWDKRIQKVESLIARVERGKWANVETGGKEAVSTFRVLGVDKARGVSWVSGLLKTGRTHQLRLHALKVDCPIVGDPVYGTRGEESVFGLHCRGLQFRHPGTGREVAVEAEAPEGWGEWLMGMG